MVRFKCKVCHRRINAIVEYSRDNKYVKFSCSKCLSSGIFRNKDYIPPIFVKNIRVVSRPKFFGVIPSQPLKLGDGRVGLNPHTNSH